MAFTRPPFFLPILSPPCFSWTAVILRRGAEELWAALKSQVPNGFGKFYPKGKGPTGAAGEAAGDKAGKAAGEAAAKAKGSGGGGGGGGKGRGQPPEVNKQVLTALVGAGLITMMLRGGDGSMGKEINWQEFVSELLESGQVARIVVVNNRIARVVMHKADGRLQGGAALDRHATGSGSDASAATAANKSVGDWYKEVDETAEGNAAPSGGAPQRGGARPGARPGLDPTHPGAAAYWFNIGSVESFERKLETTQKELGIASRDLIPVQ